MQHLEETLSNAGFLEDGNYPGFGRQRKVLRRRAASRARSRRLRLPGGAAELNATFTWLSERRGANDSSGCWRSPRRTLAPLAAWRPTAPRTLALSVDADRTFVILGTSHYGSPDRLGLTRKPFATPFGETLTDTDLVDWLAAGGRRRRVDRGLLPRRRTLHRIPGRVPAALVRSRASAFCRFSADPMPAVCIRAACRRMTTAPSTHSGRLGGVGRPGRRPAPMGLGRGYGSHGPPVWRRASTPTPASDEMEEVARRDRSRIERMEQGDAPRFWSLVQENRDD